MRSSDCEHGAWGKPYDFLRDRTKYEMAPAGLPMSGYYDKVRPLLLADLYDFLSGSSQHDNLTHQ